MAFGRYDALIICSFLVFLAVAQNDDDEDDDGDDYNGRPFICGSSETQIGIMCTHCTSCHPYECFKRTTECLQDIERDSDCFSCLLKQALVPCLESKLKDKWESRNHHRDENPYDKIYLICGIFLSFIFGNICGIFVYITVHRKCNSCDEDQRTGPSATSWNRQNNTVMFHDHCRNCTNAPPAYDNTSFTTAVTQNEQRNTTMMERENNLSTDTISDQHQDDSDGVQEGDLTVQRLHTDACTLLPNEETEYENNSLVSSQHSPEGPVSQANSPQTQNSSPQLQNSSPQLQNSSPQSQTRTLSNIIEDQTTLVMANDETNRRKDIIRKSLSDTSNYYTDTSDSSSRNSDRSSIHKTYDCVKDVF